MSFDNARWLNDPPNMTTRRANLIARVALLADNVKRYSKGKLYQVNLVALCDSLIKLRMGRKTTMDDMDKLVRIFNDAMEDDGIAVEEGDGQITLTGTVKVSRLAKHLIW